MNPKYPYAAPAAKMINLQNECLLAQSPSEEPERINVKVLTNSAASWGNSNERENTPGLWDEE